MSNQKLTPEQQRYIVTRLACYAQPRELRSEFYEEYGFYYSQNTYLHYNPTKYLGRNLSAELRELFFATRRQCMEESAAIPIANKTYRLLQLQNLADRALNDGELRIALAAFTQAAREMGGCYQKSETRAQVTTVPASEAPAPEAMAAPPHEKPAPAATAKPIAPLAEEAVTTEETALGEKACSSTKTFNPFKGIDEKTEQAICDMCVGQGNAESRRLVEQFMTNARGALYRPSKEPAGSAR